MGGERQLVELGAFAPRRLALVLAEATAAQPVECLPGAGRGQQPATVVVDLALALGQVAGGSGTRALEPAEVGVHRDQFLAAPHLPLAAAVRGGTLIALGEVDRLVDPLQRPLVLQLPADRRRQCFLGATLGLTAEPVHALQPESET